MQVYNDELYHYGVLGMKWGRRKGPRIKNENRKISTRSMRSYRETIRKQEMSKAYDKYSVQKKYKEAENYGNKHRLHLDDGGGGGAKSGEKYIRMLERAGTSEDRALREATINTTNTMIKKYGQTNVNRLKKSDRNRGMAASALVLGIPTAVLAKQLLSR